MSRAPVRESRKRPRLCCVTGLGDNTRNVGYKTGAIEFSYESHSPFYDRGPGA